WVGGSSPVRAGRLAGWGRVGRGGWGGAGREGMTSGGKRGAGLAAWLGLTVAVQAQPMPPGSPGRAGIPEPIRYAPDSPAPFLVPGPVNPLMAPPGPPSSLSLPADHSTAFDPRAPPATAWFAHVGVL